MPATRNLIIGCDGTCNDTLTQTPTNVVKLLNACSRSSQETHYEEGVGTAAFEVLPGGIYGANLDRQILGGYRFLRRRLQDKDWRLDQNRVFIFGFSRGAYAARRLAGLITHSGIPVKAADVGLGFQLYQQQDSPSANELKGQGRFLDCPIEVLGVWDTVKTTADPDFNDLQLPAGVVAGYHAIAIDEQRRFFPVLKWNVDPRVRQIWFAGVHCDVGGGYAETGLSDIALRWITDSAYAHGLKLKRSSMEKLRDDPKATMHDSLSGMWSALGKKARTISKTALVHRSVSDRMQQDYTPGNLPENPHFVDQ